MATNIFSAAPSNASDALFRAWGKGLSDALTAVGFPKTADTGQIDWATVVAPSSNTIAGYEIRRFNDALQATAPLFFKIEYGSSGSYCRIQITTGKASNGTGTVTSTFGGSISVNNSTTSATPTNCYVSSLEGSTLCIAMFAAGSAASFYFQIERSRDVPGVPTGSALSQVSSNSTSAWTVRESNYVSAATNPGQQSVLIAHVAIPTSGSVGLALGGSAPAFLGLFTDGAGIYWQSRGVAYYCNSDAGAFTPTVMTGYGTYLPLGANATGQNLTTMMAWF